MHHFFLSGRDFHHAAFSVFDLALGACYSELFDYRLGTRLFGCSRAGDLVTRIGGTVGR